MSIITIINYRNIKNKRIQYYYMESIKTTQGTNRLWSLENGGQKCLTVVELKTWVLKASNGQLGQVTLCRGGLRQCSRFRCKYIQISRYTGNLIDIT